MALTKDKNKCTCGAGESTNYPILMNSEAITMKKIVSGLSILTLIISAVIWLVSTFVTASTLDKHDISTRESYDLKYYPKEDGKNLESRFNRMDNDFKLAMPKLVYHDSLLIEILHTQRTISKTQDKILQILDK